MSFSKHVVPRTNAKTDVVGDRNHLILVGMAAVWFALLVFTVQRLVVALQTGLLTPWWGNAAGLVAMTALSAWYRRRPQTRSSGAAHGTALIATITLLIPVAYGLTSTVWWLSLVGFAAVLIGRRKEAKVWGVTILLVMVASVIVEPYVQIQGVAGELPLDLALAKIVFVVILLGMAVGFRRVAEQRALVLHDSTSDSTEALQKSQDLLTQAEKLGRVGGWEYDIETKQQTWTDMVYEIHELIKTGHPTVDQGINFYTPASRPIIEQAVQRTIEQGELFDVELEIITAKGNLRSVHAIGKADPARRKVSGFFQDITERKQAEQANALNNERTEMLLHLNQMTAASLQTIAEYAMEEAVRLTQSKIGYLAFLNDDESVLTMYSWSKAAMAECAIVDKPIVYPVASTGLWGEAVRQRRPVITNDYAAENPLKKSFPQGHVLVKRHMNVPVFDGSRIVLVAGVGNKEGEYDQNDARQMTLIMEGAWRLLERKRAEEALRLKNLVFDASLAANSIADLNGVITEANDMFLRFWGYPGKDEVVGKPLPHFFNDPNEGVAILETVNGTGRWEGDFSAKRCDGSVFVAHGLATTLRDAQGSILGYQSAVLDITERKKAEQTLIQSRRAALNMMTDAVAARDQSEQMSKELKKHRDHLEQLVEERTVDLKKSEEKFRTLADFTYDWEYWIDTDGRMLYVSPSCERITGFPPARFYEDPQFMDTIIHPDDGQIFKKHFDSYNRGDRTDETCEMEFRIVAGNGCAKWIAHSCTPVRGDNGVCLGRRVSNRDMTERKKGEEMLRFQGEITKNLSEGVYLIRLKDGIIVYANSKFEDMFGYDPGELNGKDVSIVNAPAEKNPEEIKNDIMDILLKTGEWHGEVKNIKKDGTHFWCYANVSIFDHPEYGRILVSVHTDITERKKAEMAIEEFNESLRRSNAELQASNSELEAFAYSVSHDLRAPLRTIDGFSHALLEDYDDKLGVQGKDYLRRVRASTQRMAQLIDDILKLSRVTRSEMNMEKVNLTQMAWSIIDELQKSQPERLIYIKIAEGLEDTADPRLMRVALENLLGNAWKFTGKQSEAAIEFGSTKEGEKKVYFIRDNGAGFDMAYADKLFAPFQRLHTMEEYAGTGIGLATVRRITRRHGGEVWSEGQVDKGATFYFRLQ